MRNTEIKDVDMESLMANLADAADNFSPEKREHLLNVMRTLVDCYRSEAKQGIVLLRDGASEYETMTLMAINADPTQADAMIDALCQLRGMSTAASAGVAVN